MVGVEGFYQLYACAIGYTCVQHVLMWNNIVLSISKRRTDT